MTTGNDGVPAWRRRLVRFAWTFGVPFFLALLMQYLEFRGVFASAEGMVADRYLTLGSQRETNPRIVTVSIDDEDYKTWFDSTSPLNPAALMKLVGGVRVAGALIVGVDILTDSGEYRSGFEEFERVASLLGGVTPNRRPRAPVVWAAGAEAAEVHPTSFPLWLFGEHDELVAKPGTVLGRPATDLPASQWAPPIFPADGDRTIRRLPRTWFDITKPQAWEARATFAGTIAAPYCRISKACPSYRQTGDGTLVPRGSELFVPYGSTVSLTPDFYVRDLFTCGQRTESVKGSALCTQWTWTPPSGAIEQLDGSIVLIGGTFGASRDFFDTPAGPRTAGLFINAHAVQAEIHGPVVREVWRLVTLGLDVAIGLAIGFLFGSNAHVRVGNVLGWDATVQERHAHLVVWRVVASLALAGVAAAVSYPLLRIGGYLWLSWVGMVLTGLTLHLVIETRHMRMLH